VRDRDRAREVGDERDARLQRPDEQRLEVGVVAGNVGSELRDPDAQLVLVEVDLADPGVAPRQDALRSP
jgi:hypothetical protein